MLNVSFNRFLARILAIVLSVAAANVFAAVVQSTAFTYQGQLNAGGAPPAGQTYQFTFTLYDAPTVGNVIGTPIKQAILVGNGGLFTTDLDFGQIFNGAQYWLEIQVGTTTLNEEALASRQPINAVPVAQFALNGRTSGLYTFSSGNSSINSGTYFIGQGFATYTNILSDSDLAFGVMDPGAIAKFDSTSVVVPVSGTLVSFTACLKHPGPDVMYHVHLAAEDPSQTIVMLLGFLWFDGTELSYLSPCGTLTVNSAIVAGQTIAPVAFSHGFGSSNGIAVTATFIAN